MKKNSRFKETLNQCLHNRSFVIGGIMVLSIFLIAIFADVIAPYGYADQHVGPRLQAPSSAFLFGTDELGRDIFSRVVLGTRLALWVAFLGTTLETVLGIVIGLICGYYGGWVDRFFSFITDLTWCIPGTILALAVVTVIGKGLTNTIIAISIVSWSAIARPVRAKTMSLKTMSFVETGRAFGETDLALMLHYILPNIIPSLIVMASMNLPGTIMSTTTLSFLGLGAQAPTPDWGLILSKGVEFISRAPWMSIFPGLALVYTTIGFSVLGEGLRDILDPHTKSRGGAIDE